MNAPRALALAALAGAGLVLAGCGSSSGNAGQPAASSTGSASSAGAGSAGSSEASASGASAAASAGSSTATTTATAAASPRATASNSGTASTGQCRTVDLAATLRAGSPGAGQRYATIVLRNTSGTPCTIHGYGGGQLLDAHGKPVPTTVVRDAGPVTTIRLVPGKVVSSLLHWTAISGNGEPQTGNCEPVPATLEVTPPNERTSLRVKWTLGPVCQKGRIDQQPFVAGAGMQ